MNDKEKLFLQMALDYKKEYDKCAWWKFKKRRQLYRHWRSALELVIRYAD